MKAKQIFLPLAFFGFSLSAMALEPGCARYVVYSPEYRAGVEELLEEVTVVTQRSLSDNGVLALVAPKSKAEIKVLMEIELIPDVKVSCEKKAHTNPRLSGGN